MSPRLSDAEIVKRLRRTIRDVRKATRVYDKAMEMAKAAMERNEAKKAADISSSISSQKPLLTRACARRTRKRRKPR